MRALSNLQLRPAHPQKKVPFWSRATATSAWICDIEGPREMYPLPGIRLGPLRGAMSADLQRQAY
jgi:hypothetical protein